MARNKELFYKVAAHLEKFPESYYQGEWGVGGLKLNGVVEPVQAEKLPKALEGDCDSYGCIAGHTAMLAGFVPWDARVHKTKKFTYYFGDWSVVIDPKDPKGKRHHSARVAAKALGLSTKSAEVLFHESWRPKEGMSVSDALRAIGDGKSVKSVTDCDLESWWDDWIEADERLALENMETHYV